MGIGIRLLVADPRCFLAPIILAGMLPSVHSIRSRNRADSNRLPYHLYNDVNLDWKKAVHFDLARLQAPARVVYVSSGTKALALRMVN
jgi:hypothetical protein